MRRVATPRAVAKSLKPCPCGTIKAPESRRGFTQRQQRREGEGIWGAGEDAAGRGYSWERGTAAAGEGDVVLSGVGRRLRGGFWRGKGWERVTRLEMKHHWPLAPYGERAVKEMVSHGMEPTPWKVWGILGQGLITRQVGWVAPPGGMVPCTHGCTYVAWGSYGGKTLQQGF